MRPCFLTASKVLLRRIFEAKAFNNVLHVPNVSDEERFIANSDKTISLLVLVDFNAIRSVLNFTVHHVLQTVEGNATCSFPS